MLTKIKKYVALTLVLVTFFSMNSVIANGSRSKGQSDASYANFRNVRAGRIGVNNLYRSQHPANGSSRSVYANKLAKKYGIRTVVNLSDSKNSLKRYFRKKKSVLRITTGPSIIITECIQRICANTTTGPPTGKKSPQACVLS